MTFLDDNHQPPGEFIMHNGQSHSTEALRATNALGIFAMLGYKPHITADGPAPLGYTDWVLIDGAYHREPAGTEEERAAEIERLSIPRVVKALQGRLAIKAAGLVPAFIAWKSGLDPIDDYETVAFFEAAETWEYDNPILDEGLAALGVVDQKPALFKLAATL